MDQAAQPGSRTHTPALLPATPTAATRTAGSSPITTSPDNIQVSTWEWEGGHGSDRPQAGAGPPGPDIHSSAQGGGPDRSTHVIAVPASAPQ